jgi:signal transduction histidine kinase
MRTTADALLDGTAHTFACDDGEAVQALDMEQRRQLFLFYKEALRNVVRHAAAGHVAVHLACTGGALRLDVTDDGAGFDLPAQREATGLASLEERARALGGTVAIDTRPGAGTTVRLRAPLRRMAGFRDGRPSNGRLGSSS